MLRTYTLLVLSLFISHHLLGQCVNGEIQFGIEVSPDNYPDEILWNLLDDNGDILLQGSHGEFEFCFPIGECHQWVLTDSAGDGICCQYGQGYYSLTINGNEIAEGGDFGSSVSHNFNCAPGTVCETAFGTSLGAHTAIGGDRWYSFIPDETGLYNINSCASNCETAIGVYANCTGVGEGPVGSISYTEGGCDNTSANLSVVLEANIEYFIRIKGTSESCANIDLAWDFSYEGMVEGCTDPLACNYDPFATIGTNTCAYYPDADCPSERPDLRINQASLANDFQLDFIEVVDPCYVEEGCNSGYGDREIIRFTTRIENIGDGDYLIGAVPSSTDQNNSQFEYDVCHNHWHYQGYAEYELYDEQYNVLPSGFKNGFCVMDLSCPAGIEYKYDCNVMGISAGCADIYGASLPCQWLDITDVPEGNYTVVVRVNWDQAPDLLGREETDYSNNAAQICFELTRDALTNEPSVEILTTCDILLDCLGIPFGTAQEDCLGVCDGSVLTGDMNNDGQQNLDDVEAYMVDIILNGNQSASACDDVNGDGILTITDAFHLFSCFQQNTSGTPPDPNHDLCDFPFAVSNLLHTTEFRLSDLNEAGNFFDVEIKNPLNEVAAFEFDISGISISSVISLLDQEELILSLMSGNNTQGSKVLAYAVSDNVIDKHTEFIPLARVYVDDFLDSDICMSSIQAVVNEWHEEVNHAIAGECLETISSGLDKWYSHPDVFAFPNPFRDQTSIHFPNPDRDEFDCQIFNSNGVLILEFQGIIEEELIVEGIAGGEMYTCVLSNGSGSTYTGKLFAI